MTIPHLSSFWKERILQNPLFSKFQEVINVKTPPDGSEREKKDEVFEETEITKWQFEIRLNSGDKKVKLESNN